MKRIATMAARAAAVLAVVACALAPAGRGAWAQSAQRGQHPMIIEGHTDAIGSDAHNQRLSEQRAEAVRAWLTAHGYVPASTPVKGYGKRRPVAPNTNPNGSDNPAGRQQNRRVEVVIKICP
jgi:outer membrane protein OmpA-like peptidoglycan-associated protein